MNSGKNAEANVVFVVDDHEVRAGVLLDVALRGRRVALSEDPRWLAKMNASRQRLEDALTGGEPVYGVTTGVGYSSGKSIKSESVADFSQNIVRQHGCGVGVPFTREEARAVVFARLVSLAKGYSAVRPELLDRLCALLNHDVTPVIPRFGSVGASGDLTPLSYVAAVLMGEREVYFGGRIVAAAEALAEVGIEPLEMVPKETLAMMNGTSVMTSVGLLTAARLERVLELGDRVGAIAAETLFGRSEAFHSTAHEIKPHPGQLASAAAIREALSGSRMVDVVQEGGRIIQDPYSIRCTPHVLGAARDALTWARQCLVQELNSVNDNPIVCPESGEIIFAGNFYGGHVALAMDLLKIATASVGDLFDRQFALLLDSRLNLGLPESLVDYGGNGTKALQITCSALAALAVQRSASDTVLSRPTEVSNQDKVSMGLNAAVHCAEVVELVQQVMATEMIALSNAANLRDEGQYSPAGRNFLAEIRERSPVLTADRRLDHDLADLVAFIDAI